jgi:hypothetical protein
MAGSATVPPRLQWNAKLSDPVTQIRDFPVSRGDRFDAPGLRLGVGACRLVGLDPDQLSLQAPFPESLPAPMPGSPMAR